MTELTTRRFDPLAGDYDALAVLWTACHPDLPRAGPIWRRRAADAASEGVPGGCFEALEGAQLVGIGTYDDCPVAGEPGQLQVSFAVPACEGAPEILEALVDAMREEVEALDPPALVAYARDTQPWMLTFFERHGFREAQRTTSSRYVPTGKHARAAAGESHLKDAGYGLLTVRQLAAIDPGWKRRYHAMDVAVMADIPFLGPTREESYERCERRLADPTRFDPDATFVAREDVTGDIVGVSLLQTFPEIPGYAFAGMTGVVRAHRRRGIARALKLATLDHAYRTGIDRIVTLNEENNPMLALNLELGFEVQHVQLTLQKRLGPARAE